MSLLELVERERRALARLLNASGFTLLLGAREKNFKWEPDNAPAIAEELRREVLKKTRRRIPYQVPQP